MPDPDPHGSAFKKASRIRIRMDQTPFTTDIEILSAIVKEAVTPLTIPQFWPPDSLKYRSKLIFIVNVVRSLFKDQKNCSNTGAANPCTFDLIIFLHLKSKAFSYL